MPDKPLFWLGSSRTDVRGFPALARQLAGFQLRRVQQGLDLLARVLLKPGDAVWMEDPGYFGAAMAFRNAGANIIPVPVDSQGLSVQEGLNRCSRAKAVYLTPAHQFPLGMTMSVERRLSILDWAARAGAVIIEDDYDSEYRFEGRPVPALQGLDGGENVGEVGVRMTHEDAVHPCINGALLVRDRVVPDHPRGGS